MSKSYRHIKAIAQDDKYGCWSASMAWWTKAVSTVANYTDNEIMVEYSHLRGANGGLRFPEGFRQMLQDPKWGMTVDVNYSSSEALNLIETGLKKGPVMLGFWDISVGGHHAVVVYACHRMSLYDRSKLKESYITIMDPNGGRHENRSVMWNWGQGQAIIVGYLK